MTTRARSIIIGSPDDVHVEAVQAALSDVLVVDARSLSTSQVTATDNDVRIVNDTGDWLLERARPIHGWVRRLAPEDWQGGTVSGSLQATEQSTWLTLLAGIARLPWITWLTRLDDNLIAENKLHQLAVARSLGVRVPRTVATNSADSVRQVIPGAKIVKALGRAHYLDGDTARVVFTQSIDGAALGQVDGGVPLFFQERIEAAGHLRVVTVLDRVWACALPAEGLPVDWRTNTEAHSRFEAIATAPAIRDGALEVARKLGLGYSSQDWIQTADDVVLLDVNPGGQWLFLPEPVATEVATEITRWLENQ